MVIKAWKNFSKRHNSTKQPNDNEAIRIECTLKRDTSIESPAFILNTNDFDYNYVQGLGHYYYVNDIVSLTNNLIELRCSQDLLATYKGSIVEQNAFIERGSVGYDVYLNDTLIPAYNTKLIDENAKALSIFSQNGCYVVNLVSKSTGATGFVTSFVLGYNNLTGLVETMLGIGDDWYDRIGKWVLHPYEALVSVTWIPLAFATAITKCTASNMYLGLYDTEKTGYKITDNTPIITGVSVPITHRYGDFRDGAGYTKMKLKVPYFGIIDIDPNAVINASSLYCTLSFDVQTGDCTLLVQVDSSNGEILHTVKYTTGLACPVAQLSADTGKTIASIGGAVAGFAVGGSAGAVAGFTATASALTSMASVTASYNGGINGRSQSAFASNFILTIETYDTPDPNSASFISTNGRPVCKTSRIGSHGGYVQCSNASINLPSLDNDRTEVNNLLNTGIYIE